MNSDTTKVIMGIVAIAITFFIFPIIMDGCVTILTDSGIGSYTGLADVVRVTPLIMYVGLLFGGGSMIWSGTKMTNRTKSGYASAKAKYYG